MSGGFIADFTALLEAAEGINAVISGIPDFVRRQLR